MKPSRGIRSAGPGLPGIGHNGGASYMAVSALVMPKRELRKYKGDHIRQIADSIRRFGFLVPIVVDADNRVVAGVARVRAAKESGLEEVPVIVADHLSPSELKAYRVADNKLAEGSVWDIAELKLQYEEIMLSDPDFDFEITGFSTTEIDSFLEGDQPSGDGAVDPADLDQEGPTGEVVTRVGDRWLLGKTGLHHLLCADAKNPESYRALMQGKKYCLFIGDPPYNVRVNGHVSGNGKIKHREFLEASGEMSRAEFYIFLRQCIAAASANAEPGAMIYIWIDWRSVNHVVNAVEELRLLLKNICVWNKGTGAMGSLYRSAYELCVVIAKPGAPHRNNIQLGRFGRNRKNVWDVPGLGTFSKDRQELLATHPSVKPVSLYVDIIKDVTKRGDIIVDGLAGSGTAFIAAEKTGRIARCLELDPAYCDVICRRFAKRFGVQARHAATGLTFDQMAELRRNESLAPVTPPTSSVRVRSRVPPPPRPQSGATT